MYLPRRCVSTMTNYQIRMIRLCVSIHCCNWPHTWRIMIADRLCCRWGTWRWSTTPWSFSPRLACRKHSSSAAGWRAKSRNTCSECHPTGLPALPMQPCSSDTCCKHLCCCVLTGSPSGVDPTLPTRCTSSPQTCTDPLVTCSGMSMQNLWCARILYSCMETWFQILTLMRRFKSTSKI